MHRVLRRQLERLYGSLNKTPNNLSKLFEVISKTYDGFDEDRIQLERSLEISSRELSEINETLQKESEMAKATGEKYRALFKNMNSGFAYHRMINDKTGNPYDYEFLEINEAFEQLTGLKKSVVGKTVRQVIPGIENDPTDWIGKYGKVATTGTSVTFDSYAEWLNKWFSVSAYSPQKGYFVAMFTDITMNKKAEDALRKQKDDFERLNRLMIGRELKMVELKKQLKRLKYNK